MNLLLSALIIVGVTAVAVTIMLLVRRRAPDGSYFEDGDRASGVFGVLATGFSITLGLIVVLALQSYADGKDGAETEARIVEQQYETAQLMPAAVRPRLGGELVCYGRYVVHQAWPRLESGSASENFNPWGLALFKTLRTTEPRTASEQAAYGKWLDQTSDRQAARQARNQSADGVIPTPLWIVLFLITTLIFCFMLFFADRSERPIVQGTLIGSVAAGTVATLLVIGFLNHPYHPGVGALQPVAMERALRSIDEERRIVRNTTPLPCGAQGLPR
jgi:hypothetical protein